MVTPAVKAPQQTFAHHAANVVSLPSRGINAMCGKHTTLAKGIKIAIITTLALVAVAAVAAAIAAAAMLAFPAVAAFLAPAAAFGAAALAVVGLTATPLLVAKISAVVALIAVGGTLLFAANPRNKAYYADQANQAAKAATDAGDKVRAVEDKIAALKTDDVKGRSSLNAQKDRLEKLADAAATKAEIAIATYNAYVKYEDDKAAKAAAAKVKVAPAAV